MMDVEETYERRSDVDGFTIVPRKGRRPRIHLLRAWNECNTEEEKAGEDVVRVAGSREVLDEALVGLGFLRGGIACKRCFPEPTKDEEAEAEVEAPEYEEPEEVLA
jgi:hypothetical protein